MHSLTLSMNEKVVGSLRLEAGNLVFRYENSWLSSDSCRPISLSLPVTTEEVSGQSVHSFLANLLPESPQAVELLRQELTLPSTSIYSLLEAIGTDCAGALSFSPSGKKQSSSTVSPQVLTPKQVGEVLQDLPRHPLGVRREDAFRLCLAGMQDKTGLLFARGKWWRPQGRLATTHIVKVPMPADIFPDSCENEWLCRQILAAYGLPAARSEIHVFGQQKALIVERFDRRWSEDHQELVRLPCEDFCQATGTALEKKYEADGGPGIVRCLQVLQWASEDAGDQERFLAVQVLFWALGAIDGHAKNFSCFLLPGGSIRLAPFYDVLSVWPLVSSGRWPLKKLKMAMAWEGKNRHYRWSEIRPEHFLTTAKKAGWKRNRMIDLLQDLCGRTSSVLERIHSQLPGTFPDSVAAPILSALESNMQRLDDFLRKNKR